MVLKKRKKTKLKKRNKSNKLLKRKKPIPNLLNSNEIGIEQLTKQLLDSYGEQGIYKAFSRILGYSEPPPTIHQFLDDTDWLGSVTEELFPVWRSGLYDIFPNPYYSPYGEVVLTGCLVGETKIDLLNGTSPTIEELYNTRRNGKFWVLCYNLNNNSWEPAQAHSPRLTRKNYPVFKVTLDNGESFTATPDHPILTKDNRWKNVSDLKVGDSLKSYNKKTNINGYLDIWCDPRHKQIHRIVAEWKYGDLDKYKGLDIHHKDENPFNNDPDNLCLVNKGKHKNYHQMKGYWKWRRSLSEEEFNKTIKERTSKGNYNLHNSPKFENSRKSIVEKTRNRMLNGDARKMNVAFWSKPWADAERIRLSKLLKKRNSSSEFQRTVQVSKVLRYINKLIIEYGKQNITLESFDKLSEEYSKSNGNIRKIKLNGIAKVWGDEYLIPSDKKRRFWKTDINRMKKEWPSVIEQAANFNHSVVSVEFAGYQDVYSLTVDHPSHNYPLSCGIISKNSTGGGKTTAGVLGSLYDLAKFILLQNPRKKYKLMGNKKITYAIINVTKDLAGDAVFDQMFQLIGSSPRLKRWMLQSKGDTLFPNRIDVLIGSRPSHAMGHDVVGAILDEINFQKKVANQAYDNYKSIKRRIQGRFLQVSGNAPSRVWLISSKDREASFLEAHLRKVRHDEGVRIFDYAIWEAQASKMNYSGKVFKVFVGNENKDPKLLEGHNASIGYDEAYIIDVPIEYYKEFKYDIYNALRELAGKSVSSVFKFIPSNELIKRALRLPNPVFKEVIKLDFWDKTDVLVDYVDQKNLIIPQYRENRRYIHIDMGLRKDRLGIASSFISDVVAFDKVDHGSGIVSTVTEPQYITEFSLAIESKAGSEIPIYKIKDFILFLNNNGYPIAKVTMDGFQTANLMQDLNLLGIHADYLSVDRTKDPYETLKSALLQGRWFAPRHSVLEEELKGLEDIGEKIDHNPIEGSKDTADACAGGIYSAYKDWIKFPMMNSLVSSNKNSENRVIIG